jgi:hypothetical protein
MRGRIVRKKTFIHITKGGSQTESGEAGGQIFCENFLITMALKSLFP